MVMSVNTNVGAMIALQNLAITNKMLINTQLRVTTGLRVNGPKDDAATFAIAQNMRGDIAGYGSVGISLAMGESVVNVAIDAGKSIADLFTQMKGKAVQASQEGMDQNSYNALHLEFTALREQLTTIVNTAAFNGKNLITSGATASKVLSTVEGSTIVVSAAQMDHVGHPVGDPGHRRQRPDRLDRDQRRHHLGVQRLGDHGCILQTRRYPERIRPEVDGCVEARRRQLGGCGSGRGKRHLAGLTDQATAWCSGPVHRQPESPEHPGSVPVITPNEIGENRHG